MMTQMLGIDQRCVPSSTPDALSMAPRTTPTGAAIKTHESSVETSPSARNGVSASRERRGRPRQPAARVV